MQRIEPVATDCTLPFAVVCASRPALACPVHRQPSHPTLNMADAKAARKEGGKKGVDMAGMSDLGGVKFFNLAVETPNGDLDLMSAVLEGMNVEVDEAAEERKGGAGHLGKMLLSAGDKQVAIICHVPKALQETQPGIMKEWVDAVVTAAGGKIVEEGEEVVKAVAEGDPSAEKFPLKMRDAAQAAGFQFIKSKGLIPDDDDSDDYVLDPEAAGIEW